MAVLSARARASRGGVPAHKQVCYGSKQAHSSVERAGLLAGVTMHLLDPGPGLVLTGELLQQAILEDRYKRRQKLCIDYRVMLCNVQSAGTDPHLLRCHAGHHLLLRLRPPGESRASLQGPGGDCRSLSFLCQPPPQGLWLHVDAAYAGSAFICPEWRPLLAGVELADSFNFNPHKWLLVNFDCSAMWVKDSSLLVDAFNLDPVYLQHKHQGQVLFSGFPQPNINRSQIPDYRHWHIPLGRRFRSLKLWFVMRLYGVTGLQQHIRGQVGR